MRLGGVAGVRRAKEYEARARQLELTSLITSTFLLLYVRTKLFFILFFPSQVLYINKHSHSLDNWTRNKNNCQLCSFFISLFYFLCSQRRSSRVWQPIGRVVQEGSPVSGSDFLTAPPPLATQLLLLLLLLPPTGFFFIFLFF